MPVEPDADFGDAIARNAFDVWLDPEMIRRGWAVDRRQIARALVELLPDGSHHVRFNSEVTLLGRFVAQRIIAKGEVVTSDDVSGPLELRPELDSPNNGWFVYAVIGDDVFVAFDFRRNKSLASDLLELASRYLKAAGDVTSIGPEPAVDLLYSAAELSVQAQLMSEAQNVSPNRGHAVRGEWLKAEVALNNAPEAFDATLQRLRHERSAARYGEGQLSVDLGELQTLIEEVERMISHAVERTGVKSLGDFASSSKPSTSA